MTSSENYDLTNVPTSLHWYFNDKGAWDSVKKDITSHDPTCESLKHIWCGRTGGLSAFGEQSECDDCEVTFYNEGLMGQYAPGWKTGDPVEETDGCSAQLCDCCGRKRRLIKQFSDSN